MLARTQAHQTAAYGGIRGDHVGLIDQRKETLEIFDRGEAEFLAERELLVAVVSGVRLLELEQPEIVILHLPMMVDPCGIRPHQFGG